MFTEKKVSDSENKKENLWVKIQPDSELILIPLVEYGDIWKYRQFEFGAKDFFFALPDTGESDDICRVLGLTPKTKYMMPVLVYDAENKTTSQPMYYQFGGQMKEHLSSVISSILSYVESEVEDGNETVKDWSFKGALIRVTRTGTGLATRYSANWTNKHWSKTGKGEELPEHGLSYVKGFVPFTFTDKQDYHNQVLNKLVENSSFKVKIGTEEHTLLELLNEKGFLDDMSSSTEFELPEDAKDVSF